MIAPVAYRLRAITVLSIVLLAMSSINAWGQTATAAPTDVPLPRIGIRSGVFVDNSTGKPIILRGFNYVRVRPNPLSAVFPLHDTFNPKRYSGESAERAFVDLQNNGFNVVRVFVDPASGSGIVATGDATEFSSAYMNNLFDFLERARKHRVYVYIDLSESPYCNYFYQIAGQIPADISWGNARYLYPPVLATKIEYLTAFVNAIKSHDPNLLTTIFAYEAQNEVNLAIDKPPFSTQLTFDFAGQTFDLRSSSDVQRLADLSVTSWADACADAVHRVDPQALVSASLFTFAAVFRTGPGHAWSDKSPDSRIPMDPLVVARTRVSFLDLHLYPDTAQSLDNDIKCLDWRTLKQTCASLGKPVILGEFGASASLKMNTPVAAVYLKRHVQRVLDMGFQGYLLWTYDSAEMPSFHYAREGADEIFHALKDLSPTATGTLPLAQAAPTVFGADLLSAPHQPGSQNLLPPVSRIKAAVGDEVWAIQPQGQWLFCLFGTAQGSMARDGDAVKFTVNQVDGTDWHCTIKYGLNLVNGDTYELRYQARADAAASMGIASEYNRSAPPPTPSAAQTSDDYHLTGLQYSVSLTPQWQMFVKRFVVTGAEDGHNIMPEFFFGRQTGTIWLKDISLVRNPPSEGVSTPETAPAPGPRPRTGEIVLTGTAMSVSTTTKSLLLAVTAVTLPDGTTTALAAPRPKTILIGPQTLIVTSDLTQKPLADVKEGDSLSVIGKDGGVGKTLHARTILLP